MFLFAFRNNLPMHWKSQNIKILSVAWEYYQIIETFKSHFSPLMFFPRQQNTELTAQHVFQSWGDYLREKEKAKQIY